MIFNNIIIIAQRLFRGGIISYVVQDCGGDLVCTLLTYLV